MTNDYLARLDALPPSTTLMAFRDALKTFLKEDQPGPYRAPAGRIRAKDEMDAAFAALPYEERELVRQCQEGR
jgi:hypothetical protein